MTDVQILNLDDSSTRRASHISEEQDEQSSDDRNDSEDRKSTASKHDTPTGDEITNNTINEDVYKKPSKDINYNKNTLNKDDIKKTFEKNKINLSSTLSEDFVSRLDAKLKDLEEDGKKKKKPQKSRSLDSRPLFITTVKTGIFLDPPPELAALLGYPRSYNLSSGSSYNSQKSGEELMYSFSSQPRVLNINNNKYNAAKINKVPKINNDKQQVVNNDKLQNKPNVRMKRELNNQNNVINNKK
ncbi:hypothetical protein O3M35_011763 [Rhynocoris fuscipes]|uniref:Uncharacterized protein n=1 Tax=Rhynocoris fuscipes TaxID=488301 RepID=A0AAW1D1Z1_9HEMI